MGISKGSGKSATKASKAKAPKPRLKSPKPEASKSKPHAKVKTKTKSHPQTKAKPKSKPEKKAAPAAAKRIVTQTKAAARKANGLKLIFPLKITSLKELKASLKALQNYWIFMFVAATLATAGGFMYATGPEPHPAPLTAQVQVPAPAVVAEAPAAAPQVAVAPQVEEAPKAETQVIEAPKAEAPAAPLSKEFGELASAKLDGRIDRWSHFLSLGSSSREQLAAFPGAPEIEDESPLIPGKFDCTTYVETVVALARSKSSAEFYANLLAIRYRDGKPTYLNRNHFPEADWIPNNEKAGILRDITWEIAQTSGSEKLVEKKTIDRAGWLAKQVHSGKASRALASVTDPHWSGKADAIVPYIAVGDVPKAEGKIPSGAILNIVRRDKTNMPVLITHQGFIIQKDGKTWLRHASVGGSIRTVMLTDYLSELTRKADQKDWPLVGINLNEVSGQ